MHHRCFCYESFDLEPIPKLIFISALVLSLSKNILERSKKSFNLPSLKLRQARQVQGRCLLLSLTKHQDEREGN